MLSHYHSPLVRWGSFLDRITCACCWAVVSWRVYTDWDWVRSGGELSPPTPTAPKWLLAFGPCWWHHLQGQATPGLLAVSITTSLLLWAPRPCSFPYLDRHTAIARSTKTYHLPCWLAGRWGCSPFDPPLSKLSDSKRMWLFSAPNWSSGLTHLEQAWSSRVYFFLKSEGQLDFSCNYFSWKWSGR